MAANDRGDRQRRRAQGIPLLIQRPGVKDPLEIVVKPEELGGKPTIGVFNSSELKLANEKNVLPFEPESAAAKAKGPFMPGDRIVKIGEQPIGSYGQLQDFLVAHAAEDLTVTVVRSKEVGGNETKAEDAEKVQVIVPTSPMKQFGLIVSMGTISAVQVHSPAAEAEIRAGDLLKTIDGKPILDPMKLPDQLRRRAGAEIALGLERGGKTRTVKVKLTSTPRYAPSTQPDSAVAISELGIAYFVLNTIAKLSRAVPQPKSDCKPAIGSRRQRSCRRPRSNWPNCGRSTTTMT